MRLNKNVVLGFTVFILMMFGFFISNTITVHADNLNINIGIKDNCMSTVNGSSSSSANVASGSVTIVVQNTDSIVGQTITGDNINSSVERNSRETNSTATITLESVTSLTTITFTPVPTDFSNPGVAENLCPTGSSPMPSTLIIKPAAEATTPTNSQATTNKDDDKELSETKKTSDDKDKKSTTKSNTSSDEAPSTQAKSNSKLLIIGIISATVVALAVLIYLFKIKKLKFKSFKDITRR